MGAPPRGAAGLGGAGIGLAAGFGADDGAAGVAADRGFGVAAGAAEDRGFGVAAGFGADAGVALVAGFAAGAGVFGACFVSAGAAEAFSCVRAAMAFSCSGNASPIEFRTGAESDAAFCAARSLASRAAWSRREPPP